MPRPTSQPLPHVSPLEHLPLETRSTPRTHLPTSLHPQLFADMDFNAILNAFLHMEVRERTAAAAAATAVTAAAAVQLL